MSHDCDCDECMKTDSRWAPYRRAEAERKAAMAACTHECPRKLVLSPDQTKIIGAACSGCGQYWGDPSVREG